VSPVAALLCVVGLACVAGVGAVAQDEDPPKASFQKLFPHPTGANGYEEIVMAADLAQDSERRNDLQRQGITLTDLRSGVAESDRRRALALLRAGLAKPIYSPRARPDITFTTTFPDLQGMRSVARLLAADIRVSFADGRGAEATADLERGLRLGSLLHGETLIGSLVGLACNNIVVGAFSRHLDQLSARDCDRVFSLVRAWTKLPDPAVSALEAERELILRSLMRLRNDPKLALETARSLIGAETFAQLEAEQPALVSQYLGNADNLARLVDDVAARVSVQIERALDEMRKPPWQRQRVEHEPDASPAGILSGMIVPSYNSAGARFAASRQAVSLLGVHAAIRRHQWEHDSLPASLEVLRLGGMATDPVSGKPFAYRRTGERTYELRALE
jgi:hypothetical protein